MSNLKFGSVDQKLLEKVRESSFQENTKKHTKFNIHFSRGTFHPLVKKNLLPIDYYGLKR